MRYASEKPPRRRPSAWRRVALMAVGLLLGSPASLAVARPAGAAAPTRPAGAASAAASATAASGATARTSPAQPFDEEQVLFQQKQFGYACFRIPAVVRATNGMVLAFAEGRVKDCGDDENIDNVVRRSADGGRTWGPLQVVSKGNGSTHGN